MYIIVDKQDQWLLEKWKWQVSEGGHVYRTVSSSKGYVEKVYLHRLLTSAPKGMVVDHINHNTLDNRKGNLRVCTQAQNQKNMSMHKDNKSGYKGVYEKKGSYVAGIFSGLKQIYIGTYKTAEEAGHMYNVFAEQMFGEYAKLNDMSTVREI